ncbi:MAG: Verru_Chthon cassette protein C [Verrucomicrobiales bacterium]|nr:Verru_Chthon cassette protein C [Verrucomicrobiales bacterium]
MSTPRASTASSAGFTLLELMVAAGVLALIMALIAAVTNSVMTTIRRAEGQIGAFTTARAAFDIMNQKISQATLNTYWDYYNDSGRRTPSNAANFVPTRYGRAADLQFLIRQNTQSQLVGSGQELYFQAPLAYADPDTGQTAYQSTQGLLNACSFFVTYGSDREFRPDTVSGDRYRYRLMQGVQPTEALRVFADAMSSPAASPAWLTDIAPNGGCVTPIAENVIALIVWPRLPANAPGHLDDGTELTTDYTYNSRPDTDNARQTVTDYQLPPELMLTLIVIDENSWLRLDTRSGTPPSAITGALQGRFQQSNESAYRRDLQAVSDYLNEQRVKFKILTTTVSLRESKWSDTP